LSYVVGQKLFLLPEREETDMKKGRFSEFGGQYAPETMMSALEELEQAYAYYRADPQFQAELGDLLRNYAGRHCCTMRRR
jgi:tryptophan synthase beta subunit